MSHNIRTKPRKSLSISQRLSKSTPYVFVSRQSGGSRKVILVIGGKGKEGIFDSTEWYDPKINKWQLGPKNIPKRLGGGLAVVKDNFVLYMGGSNFGSIIRSVDLLDLSSKSPNWKPTTNMLVKRKSFGVGVINNYIYAVGGFDGESYLNSAEVFDCRTQKWRMVSSMSKRRCSFGIGVLNNRLYAVGGFDGDQWLNSVECYHPGLDKWKSVAEMCVRRSSVGVGVIGGVIYAVGGHNGFNVQRSVEALIPGTGIWTTISDMHLSRRGAGVVVLDGLLYIVGGEDETSILDSVESYDSDTNTWTMVSASMNVARSGAGVVVIETPIHLIKWYQSCFIFLIECIDIYSIYSIASCCLIVSLLFFYLFSSF